MLSNGSAHGVTGRGLPPGELLTFAKSLHAIGAKAKRRQSPSFQTLTWRCLSLIAKPEQRQQMQGPALSWHRPHKPPDRDNAPSIVADCGCACVGRKDPLPPGLLNPDSVQDKA